MNPLKKHFRRVKSPKGEPNGDLTGSWCLCDAVFNEHGTTIIIETYNFAPNGIVDWTFNETNAPQQKEHYKWQRVDNETIVMSSDRGSEQVKYWVHNERLVLIFEDSMQLFDKPK